MNTTNPENCYECKYLNCNIYDEDLPCFHCIVSTENGVIRRHFERKEENG